MTKAKEVAALARGEGCLGKSQDDEPVFVLCARDPLASAVVRYWSDLANSNGVRPGKVLEARALADAMDQWRGKQILERHA